MSTSHTWSTLQRIADRLLSESEDLPLADFLESSRAEGRSHEAIARDLLEATGGVVGVSGRTIARWLDELALAS